MESSRFCNICRLCLCTGRDLMDVFVSSNRSGTTAIDLIKEFLHIEVIEESTLKWMICGSCMCHLQKFQLFKAQCIRSKLVLDGMLSLGANCANSAHSLNSQWREVKELKLKEVRSQHLGQRLPEGSLMAKDEVATFQNNFHEIHESSPSVSEWIMHLEEAIDNEVDRVMEFCWCPDCGVEFLSHQELKAHLEWCRGRGKPLWSSLNEDHEVEKMVVDESCQSNKQLLFDPTICCGRCRKVFKTKDYLIRHIEKYDFTCKPKVSSEFPSEVETADIEVEDQKPSQSIDCSLTCKKQYPSHKGTKENHETKLAVSNSLKNADVWKHLGYCDGKQKSLEKTETILNAKNSGKEWNADASLRSPDEDSVHACQKLTLSQNLPLNTSFVHSTVHCNKCGRAFFSEDLLTFHLTNCLNGLNDKFNESLGQILGKESIETRCSTQGYNVIAEVKLGSSMRGKDASQESCGSKDMHSVSSNMLLNKSLISIVEVVSYSCDYCTKPYTAKPDLRNHIVKCHLSLNPQKCNVCHKLFTNNDELEEHSLLHPKDKKFYCTICEESFCSQQKLKEHIRGAHGVNKPYMCHLCFNGFASMSDVGMHHTLAHTESEKPYKCSKCGKCYSNKENFRVHIKVCQLKTLSYQCNICGKYQTTKANLINHIIYHTGERNFPCPMCPKRFMLSGLRNVHIRKVHLKIKPFECGVCNKQFSTKWDLKQHYVVHSDDRPYSCPKCTKSCKTKYALQSHMFHIHGST